MCQIGATNLCENLIVAGITIAGSMAEFVTVPEDVVVRLDGLITALQGPLIEPLSCVLHALDRSPGWAGKNMVIFGAGPIGLIATALAVDEGVAQVLVVDPQEGRHAMAKDLGAHRVAKDVSEIGDERFDLALDASGHPAAIGAAIRILGKRGCLIQMGVASPDVTVEFSPFEIYAKEISIIGSNSLADQYEHAAARMVELGPKLEKLVTGSYRFDQVNEAMQAMRSGGPVKIHIHP
jgi:2-desacetyl-2-hydroxyethyl bacteriochlorophyllide A dehydrogenase